MGEGPVEVMACWFERGEEGGVGEFEFEVVVVWEERNEAGWCMQINAVREGCFNAGELKRS